MTSTAFCIEIGLRPDRTDVAGARLQAQAHEAGLPVPASLATRRGYSLQVSGGEEQARHLARALLCDPVLHTARVYRPADDPRDEGTRRLEVVRLPGVMDPAAQSVVRAAAHLGVEVSHVRSWQAFVLDGAISPEAAARLGAELLANGAIEEVRVDPTTGVPPAEVLAEALFERVSVPLREADEQGLLALSEAGCLALDAVEMGAIAAHFREQGRDPTDIELETLAQTWSEHCCHKTLTGRVEYEGEVIDNLLKTTIARATRELKRDFCRSVFVDNAGVVDFDDGWCLTCKVETHNHPSAIEPYGGAGTGLGGVLRDTLGTGLGARPVASSDVFCFGPPDLPAAEVPRGSLHPLRVLKGVVAGVRDYGNRMGIPTVNGAVCFDERYTANPVVYCGSVGLLPANAVDKRVEPGDRIVLLGGRTGRDGIHGATFSSQELHEESETVSSGAVQIGNAIEEKKTMDALLQARDKGLYRCVTDCGAGGLSSAVGEMAEGHGAHVVLDAVPLKYHGLTYGEIWISEAQERMVVAAPPGQVAELLALFAAEDVEATDIGAFNDSGRLTAEFNRTGVMDLSLQFLFGGLPRQTRPAQRRSRRLADPPDLAPQRAAEMLLRLLAAPNVASKEWIVRQYDHEVQAGSVIKPLVGPRRDGPSDGAVVAPVPGSRRGFALACGLNPLLGDVDPYQMALHAIDEALRNVVALGGDPCRTSILDNFSWGGSDDPENLGDLVEACRACYDGAIAFGTPFISGKDSLNNDYRVDGVKRSIPPTLLVTALSIVEDLAGACSMDLKGPGHELVLLGLTGPELGGSHLARELGALGAAVPPVDLTTAPRILAALHAALRKGLLLSCHDLSEGGLGVAAAEMAFAGCVGARLDLAAVPVLDALDPGRLLFAESPSRFLLEVDPAQRGALDAALADLPHATIGTTTDAPSLCVLQGGQRLFDAGLEQLRSAFTSTLDLDREHAAP